MSADENSERNHMRLKLAWAAFLCIDLILRFTMGSNWRELISMVPMWFSGGGLAVENMVYYAPFAVVLDALELAGLLVLVYFSIHSYGNELYEPTKLHIIKLIVGWVAYIFLRFILPNLLEDYRLFDRMFTYFSQYMQIYRIVILYEIALYLINSAFLVLFVWLLVRTLGMWKWKKEHTVEGNE